MAALRAGKSVISSNKEVVANFGDQFLAAAEENNVSYRFEAAVGGGIPVISPMISLIGHNKITEIRGILNGTTNYILTKMFSFGESFEDSLKDAQERGYAERNVINAPIQGSAADIIKVAMVRIYQRFKDENIRSTMILQVHDELNFSVYPDEREKVQQIVIEEMEKAYAMQVPLRADCGWGKNWLEAH
jgi:homoserine dehydrogenase